MLREVATDGVGVTLILDDTPENRNRASDLVPIRAVFLRRAAFGSVNWWIGIEDALATVCPTIGNVGAIRSVVSLHGLWDPSFRRLARECRARGIPYIVDPHGALTPASLRHHALRKWVAMKLWVGSLARSASMFRATSALEAEQIRLSGFEGPVALIPHAVDIPLNPTAQEREDTRRRLALSKTTRFVLFLGRLHPVKGLDLLLQAWETIHDKKSDWRLVIAGPTAPEHKLWVQRVLRKVRNAPNVSVIGPLWGRERDLALASASLVVVPSRGESFGMVVAEALAAGTPVVATQDTPWHDLAQRGSGWCVPATVDGIRDALSAACALSEGELRARGDLGRRWMSAELSWRSAGERYRSALNAVAGLSEAPSFASSAVGERHPGRTAARERIWWARLRR